MALPSHNEVRKVLEMQGLDTMLVPLPEKRPTRKGLGRYAYAVAFATYIDDLDQWSRVYRACTTAYDTMMELNVRLPHDTFTYERALVDWLISGEDRQSMDSQERVYRDKVLRWARS